MGRISDKNKGKKKYRIVRMYRERDKPSRVIKSGLTWKKAQAHCTDPKTSNLEEGWFDGWEEMTKRRRRK